MTAAADAPTAVYKFFDAAGRILYVGMTADPAVRFAYHRSAASWWGSADQSRTEMTWYETRALAAAAELEAIAAERPPHNVIGVDGYRGGRLRYSPPTPEVAAEIDKVVALFHQYREAVNATWEKIQEARDAGVPDTVLCLHVGVSRSTLNRRLGSRSDTSE